MLATVFYMIVLLALVGSALWQTVGREGWQRSIAFLLAWIGIFGLVFVGYSFRYELKAVANRVISEFDPTRAAVIGPGRLVILGDSRGHYMVRVKIRGEEILMLVDTGATNVVLTPQHAEKIGLDPSSLVYNVPVFTAGGMVHAAQVNLKEMVIGNIVIDDVKAYVSKMDMDQSLLGMSFLSRLDRISVTESGLEMVGSQ